MSWDFPSSQILANKNFVTFFSILKEEIYVWYFFPRKDKKNVYAFLSQLAIYIDARFYGQNGDSQYSQPSIPAGSALQMQTTMDQKYLKNYVLWLLMSTL